ncbi:MAG: hypothetical protein RL514_3975 [Verrucomicrobiota bacterium]|jgi:hypothetical protein
MKNSSLLLLGALALPTVASAQNLAEPVVGRHHFGASLPVWLNAHAKFTSTRATNPGPGTGSASERFYDDGYSRVDSTGNAPAGAGLNNFPRTSFFGYASDVQVNNVVGAGTLDLHSAQLNGGDYTRNLENKPQFPGLELFYRYDWKAGDKWRVSWELGAAYNYFKWEQNGAPNATVNLITDVFQLGGVTIFPGSAPYSGPFTGLPGSPVIGSTPTRTEVTAPAAVTGTRKLELHALQFRVGPALDWVPNDQWTVGIQGGLALGVGWSQLGFAEQLTVTAANLAPINQSGRTSDVHSWAGWFSAVKVGRKLSEHWDAHVEVRHTWMEALQHNGAIRSGEMNLSDGVGLGAGVSYRF